MKRAYTLMEVLSVMAIILLVFGLLVGSIRRSAESAARSACLSNEHHLTAGLALYTQDFDGQFPRVDNGAEIPLETRSWTVTVKPYCGIIRSCPRCQRPSALVEPWADSLVSGYALNENLNRYHAYVSSAGER